MSLLRKILNGRLWSLFVLLKKTFWDIPTKRTDKSKTEIALGPPNHYIRLCPAYSQILNSACRFIFTHSGGQKKIKNQEISLQTRACQRRGVRGEWWAGRDDFQLSGERVYLTAGALPHLPLQIKKETEKSYRCRILFQFM